MGGNDMKKLLIALAAAALLCCFASAALALEAVYQDGMVTVTTDGTGFYEILIDGENTNRWVGEGMPGNTFSWELEEHTEHQLILLSLKQDGLIGGRCSFWAGDPPAETPAPTMEATEVPVAEEPAVEETPVPDPAETPEPEAQPTEEPIATATPVPKGPVKISSVSYQGRTLEFTVSGMRVYAEVWIDGQSTGKSIDTNGLNTMEMTLSSGKHTLMLFAPAVNEADEKSFQAQYQPDPQVISPEALGEAIRGEDRAALHYTSSFVEADDRNVLVLTVEEERQSDQISLYLSDALIKRLTDEGLEIIRFESGNTALWIELDQINVGWFNTDKAIWYYVFTVAPLSAESTQVTVSAQTSSTEMVEAVTITGVSLQRDGNTIPVDFNDFY